MYDPAQLRPETLPHSVEAEQQVLGEMLLQNCEGPGYAAAVHAGGADLFYDPVHRRIFDVCHSKALKGFLVSPVTVSDVLLNDDGLRELNGPKYLVRMAGNVLSSASGAQYVAMLADLKRKRELIQAMNVAQSAIARKRPA